jgi:hypothetical protein
MSQRRCFSSSVCQSLAILSDYCFIPQSTVAVALSGLFVGAASQGLAYVMVCDDDTVRNIIASHCGLFCLFWTVWTVGLNVLVGWKLTRCGPASLGSESTMHPTQQRAMLRMESMFFAGSIVGIWSSFATILHCLPEESRLEDPVSEVGQGSYVPPPVILSVQTV